MFPKIPEDRTQMSASDLRGLAAEIKEAISAALSGDEVTAETVAAAKAARDARKALLAEADAYEATEAEAASLAAEMADEDEDEASDEDDTEASDEAGDEASEDAENEASTAKVYKRTVAPPELETEQDSAGPITAAKILSKDGVSGKKVNQAFDDWEDFAKALLNKAEGIKPNSSERFDVGRIKGRFDDAHTLVPGDAFGNLRKLGVFDAFQTDEEIKAACCAPLPPSYDVDCFNTTRRPVRGSLGVFQLAQPRGGVTIYPSPSLDDVSADIWTCEDDANPEAEKTCSVIECADVSEFRMHAIYHCLTVKNMLAMTFPELVAAYLNRGAALHARIAEIALLEGMGAGRLPIQAAALGYGATSTITTQILQYLTLERETERWDDVPMVGYAHRSLLNALRIDGARRRRTDGGFSIPSEADINARFAEAGIERMVWFLDVPSWSPAIPPVASGGDLSAGTPATLGSLPTDAAMLVAPIGKFAAIDRGELSIGVTGNNIYRDNASNAANEFTFFFENFEGVVDTDLCRADLVVWEDLCYNGGQIADLAIDCEGLAEAA